jgi:hypothetical protein
MVAEPEAGCPGWKGHAVAARRLSDEFVATQTVIESMTLPVVMNDAKLVPPLSLAYNLAESQLLEAMQMGVDLEVMATHFRERRGEFLPTATLRFDRDYGLFGQLEPQATPCIVSPIPEGLKVGRYEEEGLRFTATDRYGRPLRFTTPADLRQLRVPDDVAPWNRAVLAFLLALPPDARIVLFWC